MKPVVDMKLWAVSMRATREVADGSGYLYVPHAAAYTNADTEAQAYESAMKEARRVWPVDKGWTDHHILVVEIDLARMINVEMGVNGTVWIA